MTQTHENSPAARAEWAEAEQVGELTMAAWHVQQMIREVAHGLGVDADNASRADAVALVKRRIEKESLPRWTEPSVAEVDFVSWLDDAGTCLDEVDTSVSAAARAGKDRQPFTVSLPATMQPEVDPSGQPTYRWFTAGSFGALQNRCAALSTRGERLVESLGLHTAGGSTQYGYHHIARLLYDVLADPLLSVENRAALTPSMAIGRRQADSDAGSPTVH